jgi:hypothetical protein
MSRFDLRLEEFSAGHLRVIIQIGAGKANGRKDPDRPAQTTGHSLGESELYVIIKR